MKEKPSYVYLYECPVHACMILLFKQLSRSLPHYIIPMVGAEGSVPTLAIYHNRSPGPLVPHSTLVNINLCPYLGLAICRREIHYN